nr:monovalent cation/H(+) antiporter subunit G [Kytococcus aerolatus]
MVETTGGVLMLLGSLTSLLAAVGLLRFPDLLTRMHAATKPQSLGLILLAAGLGCVLRDPWVWVLLTLVVLFQFLTVPVAAHMVGRGSLRTGQVRLPVHRDPADRHD